MRPIPRPALLQRLADEFQEVYGIVHWGLNTYTDREWGYGDEDPAILAPARFDADQIAGACAAGGLAGLIVVAKHHDGFCLWPTATTPHNISRSPFRGGRGDYVREMADACRRAGIRFGVYISPWDRNCAFYASPRYLDLYRAQIRELLGGAYGDVFEMWFDGANGGTGYYGGARDRRTIPDDYYRFDATFRLVRELQPSVCLFNEDDGADFRWPGNERGILVPDSRATVPPYDKAHYPEWGNAGRADGSVFHPAEADFPLRPGWFFHESERGRAKGPEYLMKTYLRSVGHGGTMNIGVAPTRDGVLDDEDVQALRGFGELRRRFFAHEAAAPGEPFNVVVLREDLSRGEQIDGWELLADGRPVLSGGPVGIKRIRVLDEPIAPRACELRVTAHAGDLQGATLRRYLVDPALLRSIASATNDSGETETAQWMTAGVEGRHIP